MSIGATTALIPLPIGVSSSVLAELGQGGGGASDPRDRALNGIVYVGYEADRDRGIYTFGGKKRQGTSELGNIIDLYV
jgi:hypothetical protein